MLPHHFIKEEINIKDHLYDLGKETVIHQYLEESSGVACKNEFQTDFHVKEELNDIGDTKDSKLKLAVEETNLVEQGRENLIPQLIDGSDHQKKDQLQAKDSSTESSGELFQSDTYTDNLSELVCNDTLGNNFQSLEENSDDILIVDDETEDENIRLTLIKENNNLNCNKAYYKNGVLENTSNVSSLNSDVGQNNLSEKNYNFSRSNFKSCKENDDELLVVDDETEEDIIDIITIDKGNKYLSNQKVSDKTSFSAKSNLNNKLVKSDACAVNAGKVKTNLRSIEVNDGKNLVVDDNNEEEFIDIITLHKEKKYFTQSKFFEKNNVLDRPVKTTTCSANLSKGKTTFKTIAKSDNQNIVVADNEEEFIDIVTLNKERKYVTSDKFFEKNTSSESKPKNEKLFKSNKAVKSHISLKSDCYPNNSSKAKSKKKNDKNEIISDGNEEEFIDIVTLSRENKYLINSSVCKIKTISKNNLTVQESKDNIDSSKFIEDNENFEEDIDVVTINTKNKNENKSFRMEKSASKRKASDSDDSHIDVETEQKQKSSQINESISSSSLRSDTKRNNKKHKSSKKRTKVKKQNYLNSSKNNDDSENNKCRVISNMTSSYECDICKRYFASKDSLLIHVIKHLTKSNFRCKICDKVFSRYAYFTAHVKMHSDEKLFHCEFCKKVFFNRKDFTSHIINHMKSKYKCRVCKQAFFRKKGLQKHEKEEHSGIMHKCPLCDKSFKRTRPLQGHLRSYHYNSMYKCELCEKTYKSISGLHKHKSNIHKRKNVTCHICKRILRDKSNLSSHMLTHYREKNYICNYCHKIFKLKENLRSHILFHTGAKVFECVVCKAVFKYRTSLTSHMNTHKSYKPFQCSICCKNFQDKNNFNFHVKTHSNINNYDCSICGQSFHNKTYLKRHIDRRHSNQIFECDYCKKTYPVKSNLFYHIKSIHLQAKQMKCTKCGKFLCGVRNLRDHLLVHDGIKPFKCSICEKTFRRKTLLNGHVKKEH